MGIERFSFPTTIHFGAGARKLIGAHLTGLGIRRPLVVTDRGIAALPLLQASSWRSCPASTSASTRTSPATRCAAR